MLSMDVSADSLVCRPCRHDVTRVLADAAYVPRWRKGSGVSSNSYCCVRNCNQVSFAQASMCSSDELQAYRTYSFKVSLFLSLHPYARPITMWCMMHCTHGTNTAELVVDACDREMIGLVHNHMPFQAYLSEHTDFAGDIVRSDRVCLTCYKSHLVLLKAYYQR